MGDAATPVLPDFASQTASVYKANIDAGFAVSDRLSWAFASHEQSTPDMTVRLDAGSIFDGTTLTNVAAQSTGTITAPTTNPRIDRVVTDRLTGAVSVITGTENASPVPPAITTGKVPTAQVALVVSQSSIINNDITDERSLALDQADLDVPSQSEAETGTSTTERVWTAERVSQGAQVGSINVRIDGADGAGSETTEVQAGIDRAVTAGKPLVLPDPVYTTGALNTVGAMLSSRTVFYSDARGLAETLAKVDVDAASALTHTDEDFVYSYRNSNLSGNDIYAPIFPGIDHYDVLQGVCDIVNGGTIEGAIALAGYVKNLDATVNGVCLFGCGYVDVNGGSIWGINTLLQDDAVRAAGSDTGRILFNELDFNVMHPNTQVIGIGVGGNSLAQPTNAIGFNVAVLGTGFNWITGLNCADGAADDAVGIGQDTVGSGANISSQYIHFVSTDSGSTRRSIKVRAEAGDFLVFTGPTSFGLKIAAGNLLLDSGKSIIVNGISVLGDRKTGWTAATGTATRTTFATGSVTLVVLAEHVKALIDDFISHGAIGA